MRVEYELTPDDWAAFGEHCARTAPGFQKTTQVGLVIGMLLILGCSALLSLRAGTFLWLFAGMVAALIWGLYWPWYVVSHARSHMRVREQPCLRGGHLIEAVAEGLHAKCDITESTVRWPGIRSVSETPDHVFVMLSDVQGYIIPKRRVTNGSLELLLQEIDHYRK